MTKYILTNSKLEKMFPFYVHFGVLFFNKYRKITWFKESSLKKKTKKNLHSVIFSVKLFSTFFNPNYRYTSYILFIYILFPVLLKAITQCISCLARFIWNSPCYRDCWFLHIYERNINKLTLIKNLYTK